MKQHKKIGSLTEFEHLVYQAEVIVSFAKYPDGIRSKSIVLSGPPAAGLSAMLHVHDCDECVWSGTYDEGNLKDAVAAYNAIDVSRVPCETPAPLSRKHQA